MKKLFTLLLCFIFIGIVNAEKCTVVTGDGSHIGDEIKCGTEHFYIINTNNEKTTLFAKYNLLAGDKIDAFEVTQEEANSYGENEDDFAFCERIAKARGYDPYYVYPLPDKNTCRVYEKLSSEHIKQDAKAVGTYVANRESVLPIYGIAYTRPDWGYDAIVKNIIHDNDYDNDGNLIIEGSSFEEYIVGYKNELKSQGIDVLSVGMPGLNTMIDFLEDISGREVVSNFTDDDDFYDPDSPYFFTLKQDLKEYIPEKFKWVYDRAYWLGSGYNDYGNYYDYYMSNEGLLCLMDRGMCNYRGYPMGNGIRPIATINTEDINYIIETKTDGNGKIKVEKIQAKGGEVIKFTIEPNEGYVLGSVKVTDANGKVVTFTDYTFTMPNANVLIEAVFLPANPETTDIAIILLLVLAILAASIAVVNSKRLKEIL